MNFGKANGYTLAIVEQFNRDYQSKKKAMHHRDINVSMMSRPCLQSLGISKFPRKDSPVSLQRNMSFLPLHGSVKLSTALGKCYPFSVWQLVLQNFC